MRERLYCDANIFIDALEGTSPLAVRLANLLESASAGAVTLITSTLTLAETLVKPLADKNQNLISAYTILLSNDAVDALETIDIDRAVLAQAAFVRVRKASIRLPDAIHIATAERAGCTRIITRDTRWSGATRLPLVDPASDSFASLSRSWS